MMDKLRGAWRSTTVWVNGILLTLWPFAGDLVIAAHQYLPDLAQFLPADIYKWVGGVIAVFNIIQRARTTQSLAEKGIK